MYAANEFDSAGAKGGCEMKAWTVKLKEALLLEYICINKDSVATWARKLNGSTVVPVEITEIVEGQVESKEPDWEAAYDEMMSYFHSLNMTSVTGAEALRVMRKCRDKHTPKPETLESVVREFCVEADYLFYDSGKRSARMFNKMRELAKEEK